MLRFNLNGAPIEYSADPSRSLLSFLRNDQHLTAAKDGCSAQVACGACLVEVDGKAALACATPLSKVEGKNVVTLEGFPEELKQILGKAFVQKGAVQCGFCTPGFLTRAKILLQSNPNPTREEVIKAVRPHLCRCTGYVKLVDAILEAARVLREGGEQKLSTAVGTNSDAPRYKGYERAVGTRPFVDDMFFDGMLHGALHFCAHPRARVLKVDVSAAQAMPGVKMALTAKDIPGVQCSGLHIKDWPLYVAEGQISRNVGDVLACVIADTMDQARAAAAAVQVEYEVLEPLLDPEKSETSPIKITENGNLLKREAFVQGDPIEKALAGSAFTAEGHFETQAVEHAFLEMEASVALPENGGIKLYSMGQDITHDRKDVAALLNLPLDMVHVTLADAGGGFGGKEDLTTQGHAALGALLLQRPVKVKLSRGESLRMHAKRHATKVYYAIGCDKDGKFTALKARILGDSGAYASTGGPVMGRAAVHATGAYHFPNQDIESKAVYTNNLTAGAFRGFGVNQVVFAVESLIDELCQKGGFDRWQIRYDNAMREGSLIPTGQILEKGASYMPECLLAVKDAFKSAKYAGIACAIKNAGFGNAIPEESRCFIDVLEQGRIIINHSWTEMGQGVHTAARQILCEYLGLQDNALIDVRSSTNRGAFSGGTTASRGSFQLGHAILNAARGLKTDLEKAGGKIESLAGRSYQGDYRPQDFTTKPQRPGETTPARPVISHQAYSFGVNVVVCDEKGKIEKIVAAHDSGRPINRLMYEGQVEGGVVMGLGYALSEQIPFAEGKLTSEKFRDLGLLRSTDVPPIEVVIVDNDDPEGPLGVKGIGEITCIATAPAVTNALRVVDGKARYKLPLSETK